MIQQAKQLTQIQEIQSRFKQVCRMQPLDKKQIDQFVYNLFQIQRCYVGDSGLDGLIKVIIKTVNDQGIDKNQKIWEVIFMFLNKIVRQVQVGQFQFGVFCSSELLGNKAIRGKIKKLYQNTNTYKKYEKQLIQSVNQILNAQNYKRVRKNLQNKQIQQNKNKNTLGLIKIIIILLFLLPFVPHSISSRIKQIDLIDLIQRSTQYFINKKIKTINEQQLKILVQMCLDYERLNSKFNYKGYKMAQFAIYQVLSIDNLQKKLSALSCLDIFLAHIQNYYNSSQILTLTNKFLTLILQPRNHIQIVNRSLNFLRYWIQYTKQQKSLQLQILQYWLIDLILKADSNTSNTFSNLWNKLIISIQKINSAAVKIVYHICKNIIRSQLLDINKKYKLGTTQLQLQNKIIKLLAPVIHKQFKPVHIHEKDTYNFLQYIWENKQNCSKSFQKIVTQQMKKAISQTISKQFNIYVLDKIILRLNFLIMEYKIIEKDENTQIIQQQIIQIYLNLKCLLFSLSSFPKNILQIINTLTKSQVATNLILAHRTNNKQQLQQLLNIFTLICQYKNDQQFIYINLNKIINKVNNSQQIYLIWMCDMINLLKYQNLRNKIIKYMFRDVIIYKEISEKGFEVLMSILVFWQDQRNKKIQYCISLLSVTQREQSIITVFNTIWTPSQLYQYNTLQQIGIVIQKLNISPQLQISIYRQLLKITPLQNNCSHIVSKQKIFSQQIALQQQVIIKLQIIYNSQLLVKVVKCNDCINFNKFKINQINNMLGDKVFKDYEISKIIVNGSQMLHDKGILSLRNLGFQASRFQIKENKVVIILDKNKTNTIFCKLTTAILKFILDNFYKKYHTKNILSICQQKQLQKLIKTIPQCINKVNLQFIQKYQLFLIIIKLISSQKSVLKTQKQLATQIIQFLIQIDTQQILSSPKINTNYTHAKFMQNEYFISKACNLLQNDKINIQRIGYQFFNMLQVVECIIKDLHWLQYDPIKYCYLFSFFMQNLWIILTDQTKLKSFLQSGKYNDILYAVLGCVKILLNHNIQNQQIITILLRIILTGIKIFNKIIQLIILFNKNFQLPMLITQPIQLLNLSYTKQSVTSIFSKNKLQKLLSQSQQFLNLYNITKSTNIIPILQIPQKQIVQLIISCYNILPQYKNNRYKQDIFIILYQISRLNSWILLSLKQSCEQQEILIGYMIKQLNSQYKQINCICRSLIYIYVLLDSDTNCVIILNRLLACFNNRQVKLQIFYEIFGELFSLCTNDVMIQKILSRLFDILIGLKPDTINQSNPQLISILFIIKSNTNKLSKNVCQFFLNLLLSHFLFSKTQQIKAIHHESRAAIYKVIQAFLSEHNQINACNLYEGIKQNIKLANSISNQMGSSINGVGLQNMGNICYMNSLLQILYSITSFKQQLLQIKSSSPLLHNLQNLFINLSKNTNKSITPQQFILSFDPPIDVRVQQDTTQFMINLLDKLQWQDKSGKLQKYIKNYLSGQNISKMVCVQCKNKIQIKQDYILYHVGIENQGKYFNNLQQCIQNNKKSQIIYDVNCQKCKKLTKFNKQTQLNKIPNYFIVHLKRLIFDYKNPYQKIKIHSRLQFPDILQINQQKLQLKGVITHCGSGQSGHYFTTVKKGNDWIIYNDALVYKMKDNQKEQLWYGSKQDIDYSTTAYVLLYQKQNKQSKINKSQISLKSQLQFPLSQQTKNLQTKQMLLSQSYIKDFTNFAFNIAKHPSIPNKMGKIYEMLALLSYINGIITDVVPCQYFLNINIKDKEQAESLIEIVYQYKDNNLVLLFHNNKKLRQFFYNFLTKVFDFCLPNCQLAQKYACQYTINYFDYLKQQQNFSKSTQSLKLLSYILVKLHSSSNYLKQFYSSSISQKIIQLFLQNKQKLQQYYNNKQNKLIQNLLQFIIACIQIGNKCSQKRNIIMYQNQYLQNLQYFQQLFLSRIDNNWLQLAYMYNTNYNYCQILQTKLQLLKQQKYHKKLSQIIYKYMNKWQLLNNKNIQNLCYLIWHIYFNYYKNKQQLQISFYNAFLGLIHPIPVIQPHISLKQCKYLYLNNELQPALIQVITYIMCQIDGGLYIDINDIVILADLVKLLVYLLNDKVILDYFVNLWSPIVIYCNYYQYFVDIISRIIHKGLIAVIQIVNKENLQQKIKQLKLLLESVKNLCKSQNIYKKNAILCGIPYKDSLQLKQTIVNSLFITVQQYDCYWLNSHNIKFLFLKRTSNQLNDQQNLQKLSKTIQITNLKTMQQQLRQCYLKLNQTNLHQSFQKQSQNKHNKIRIKLSFTNINEQFKTIPYIIQIHCNNMKNKVIQILLKLQQNQSRNIWIQKLIPSQKWGNIKIYINGLQLQIQTNQYQYMNQNQQILQKNRDDMDMSQYTI